MVPTKAAAGRDAQLSLPPGRLLDPSEPQLTHHNGRLAGVVTLKQSDTLSWAERPPSTRATQRGLYRAGSAADPIRGSGRRRNSPVAYPTMVMGTIQAAATAAVAGGVHETTVRSPEAMDRPTMEATAHPTGSPAATIGGADDLPTEDRLEVEVQEAHPAAATLPGLAPGRVKAKAASARSRKRLTSVHCRDRLLSARLGSEPFLVRYL